jgi:polyisoprenoid-binding protein YceI
MATQAFTFDFTHSSVGFTARHMIVSKVHGKFGKWGGTLNLDLADLTKSSVEVQIETASIDTGVGQRDDHLRSPDFFDAPNHPLMTFKSRRIERVSPEEYRLIGDLQIRGTTKEVSLVTEFGGQQKSPWGDLRAGFSAKASVDRRDFGLTWNKAIEAGGFVVSDKIDITIEVEAIGQAAAAAA